VFHVLDEATGLVSYNLVANNIRRTPPPRTSTSPEENARPGPSAVAVHTRGKSRVEMRLEHGVAIVALATFVGRATAPAAIGRPYAKE
jgi:hypothetical protein